MEHQGNNSLLVLAEERKGTFFFQREERGLIIGMAEKEGIYSEKTKLKNIHNWIS